MVLLLSKAFVLQKQHLQKSRNLNEIGVAFIIFPDPSPIGEIIGSGFIAAGLVQKGIQKQTIYLGEIKKTSKAR